jgi:hypothetical protein
MALGQGRKQGPTQAPNKTPAPTGRDFGFGGQTYGTNQFQGKSSADVGTSVTSALADELRRAGTGEVLDRVIQHGVAKDDNVDCFQTRKLAGVNVGKTFGMTDPGPNPAVPSRCGFDNAPPVRQPTKR